MGPEGAGSDAPTVPGQVDGRSMDTRGRRGLRLRAGRNGSDPTGRDARTGEERVTKLVGNPAHPLSRGRLCPRGAGATGLLYDPDRLRRPLVRRAKRGDDVFDEDPTINQLQEKVAALFGHEAALFCPTGSMATARV